LPQRQLDAGHLSGLSEPCVDTVEALVGLGELENAQSHLEHLRTLPSIRYRRAQIGAARAEGLLAAARGDREAAVEALHASLAADDPPTYPLERGRTLLALGAVLRQAKQRRAARETLGEAVALLESLGARPWADKARAELGRISGRVAVHDELTATERAIAEHAAAGRQNKEIAAAMFITVRTVESHLTRIYRKVGVRSRAELAGRFAREG
jgi:DNA-binding CsgD family transcriptional regulator